MSNKESAAVQKYLDYIQRRIVWLERNANLDSIEEIQYYTELRDRIYDWGKSHVLAFKHITGKMTMKELIPVFGCSERTIYRILKPQIDNLVKFIQEQEEALEEKYSFVQ